MVGKWRRYVAHLSLYNPDVRLYNQETRNPGKGDHEVYIINVQSLATFQIQIVGLCFVSYSKMPIACLFYWPATPRNLNETNTTNCFPKQIGYRKPTRNDHFPELFKKLKRKLVLTSAKFMIFITFNSDQPFQDSTFLVWNEQQMATEIQTKYTS